MLPAVFATASSSDSDGRAKRTRGWAPGSGWRTFWASQERHPAAVCRPAGKVDAGRGAAAPPWPPAGVSSAAVGGLVCPDPSLSDAAAPGAGGGGRVPRTWGPAPAWSFISGLWSAGSGSGASVSRVELKEGCLSVRERETCPHPSCSWLVDIISGARPPAPILGLPRGRAGTFRGRTAPLSPVRVSSQNGAKGNVSVTLEGSTKVVFRR